MNKERQLILYKYLRLAAAREMIRTCTLGFTQPLGLNDPTETTASGHAGDKNSFWRGFNRRFSIETNFGILSMTRNAINATMWSHYGKGHTGLVIGIDTDLAGLNDESTCVLPARYGSVIYTVSKPISSYQQSNAEEILSGRLARYDPLYIEALQRIFLYKSSEWYYEEEVRAVKTIASITEDGGQILGRDAASGAATYLAQIPKGAIQSVHLGLRVAEDYDALHSLCSEITQALPNVELFDYRFEEHTWRLVDRALGDWSATLHEDYYPTP